jgi:lipoate-protein ligase B
MSADRVLEIRRLGLRPYREVWDLQKKLQAELIAGAGRDTLILCRHPAVITLGRSAKSENVLASAEELSRGGVERFEIERGGDVTFHGPGQLVAYPIVNLNFKKRDVGWYMRSLEEMLIRLLARYAVKGQRIDGKTGVWVESCDGAAKKIASIGVRISRWCTMHGAALNVEPDVPGFSLINPCGFNSSEMTSMAECLKDGSLPKEFRLVELEDVLVQYFVEVFDFPVFHTV